MADRYVVLPLAQTTGYVFDNMEKAVERAGKLVDHDRVGRAIVRVVGEVRPSLAPHVNVRRLDEETVNG